MDLSRDDYLTVQQIYRGWALLGIALIGALIVTLVLAIAVRRKPTILR
jgi:ABC-type cobalamin transport system permease subunit